MHHKFAVVDRRLLINGSFNWTRNAVLGNSENLVITNSSSVTRLFNEEFDKLWDKYDPLKKTETLSSQHGYNTLLSKTFAFVTKAIFMQHYCLRFYKRF